MTVTPAVELLCLTQRAPLLLQGTLETTAEKEWRFTPDIPLQIDVVDCNAIVNTGDDKPMMTLHIVEQTDDGKVLELRTISTHPREKRSYPRLFSMINLDALPTASDSEMDAWIADPQFTKADADWIHPEPFMNFSVNGVAFTWSSEVPQNTKLLVQLEGNVHFRAIARVVRCAKNDDNWDIALYFEQMTDAGIQHLVDLTMRLQDDML